MICPRKCQQDGPITISAYHRACGCEWEVNHLIDPAELLRLIEKATNSYGVVGAAQGYVWACVVEYLKGNHEPLRRLAGEK